MLKMGGDHQPGDLYSDLFHIDTCTQSNDAFIPNEMMIIHLLKTLRSLYTQFNAFLFLM